MMEALIVILLHGELKFSEANANKSLQQPEFLLTRQNYASRFREMLLPFDANVFLERELVSQNHLIFYNEVELIRC